MNAANPDFRYFPEAPDEIDGVMPPEATLELIGHEEQKNQLAGLYRDDQLHHAWLFSGPRGIGKATLALRFAEHLQRFGEPASAPEKLSLEGDAIHHQVSQAGHPNVLVFRRAYDNKAKKFKSAIAAEELRTGLNRFLGQAAGANSWRVVIIDAADDLNRFSANALLKPLEEPPARTIFLILAHSARGLLPTIRSRCQLLRFKPLDDAAMAKVFLRHDLLAKIDEEKTAQILRLAEGSVRRALLLASSETMAGFEAFIGNAQKPRPDYTVLHQIFGVISSTTKNAEFDLFVALVQNYLTGEVRNKDRAELERLCSLAILSQKLNDDVATVKTWNLDRKQMLLNLFEQMHRIEGMNQSTLR